jgi:cell volume regulation protein A
VAAVELISMRDFPGEFAWYRVEAASAVADAFVRDLALPEGCLVTLVVRGREVVVPRGSTQLLRGDEVCVFVTPEARVWLDLIFGGED